MTTLKMCLFPEWERDVRPGRWSCAALGAYVGSLGPLLGNPNNLGFPNSYNNQGYRQNQLQDGYQVNPNQNQNVLATPSNNPFSSSNNSFYDRGYNQRWNNPFKE